MDETTNTDQGGNWFDEFLGSVAAGIRVYQADKAAQAEGRTLSGMTIYGNPPKPFPWVAVIVGVAVLYVVME